MNVTFFLGNGFDININLKTRYKDFYPFFMENGMILFMNYREDNLYDCN